MACVCGCVIVCSCDSMFVSMYTEVHVRVIVCLIRVKITCGA